jgi:flagellar basal-body rod modification protein FlgD
MSSTINSTSQTTTSSTAKTSSNSSATTSTKTKETGMGKEDFLTLLVAQLKNQDPLNPDNPTEFTAQLAQFSSLEQLFSLNENVNKLVDSNANADKMSTLSTIGKDVAYNGSGFKYSGEPVTIGYQLDSPASQVTVDLQLNGATVKSFNGTDLTAGNHYITWDGLSTDGVAAPNGNYKIVLSAKAPEGQTAGIAPLIKSEVTGVDLNGTGGATLITKAGQIAYSSVIGIYDPGSKADTTTTAKKSATSATDAATVADATKSAAETANTVAALIQ